MLHRKILASTIALAMLAAVFVFVPHESKAIESSADSWGYHWTDSNSPEPGVTFDWIDISSSGIDAGFLDDDNSYRGPFPIGFDFEFYGETYSMFNVSSEGLLMFGTSTFDSYNEPIADSPGTDSFIAPYWDNLIVSDQYGYGAVFYETVGSSPNMQLVVQWDGVHHQYDWDVLTFEVILNETGEIWIQYFELEDQTGSSATVGIESPDGGVGCSYSFNTPSLFDGLAIMFSQGPIGFGPDSYGIGARGELISYDLSIRNNQLLPDSFDIEAAPATLGWPVNLLDGTMAPLIDNNLNGIPDTGELAPGESFDIIATVVILADPGGLLETTIVTATSYANPLLSDDAMLTTETYQAYFSPPHNDYGFDEDEDGDFDLLVIEVVVDSVVPGQVSVAGDLYTSGLGQPVGGELGSADVSAGLSSVFVNFSGEDVFSCLEDGTFDVELQLYDAGMNWIGSGGHTTSSYVHDQFDPPPALFLPPGAERVPDADEDLLYDSLVIDITLDVYDGGEYTVEAQLYDYDWNELSSFVVSDTYSPGSHIISFETPGWVISSAVLDGPYYMYLGLFDSLYVEIDSYEYETAAYLRSEFEPSPATFAPPHDDYGRDTDSDGLFNEVVITIYIDCLSSGEYRLQGTVEDDESYVFMDFDRELQLDGGTSTGHEIILDRMDILEYGISGEFYVDMRLIDNLTMVEVDAQVYATSTYWSSDFDELGACFDDGGMFNGRGIDLNDDGQLELVVVTGYVNASSPGYYTIETDVYEPLGALLETQEYADFYLEENDRTPFEVMIYSSVIQTNGVDGSWHLEMRLYDSFSHVLYDETFFDTEYYYVDDFEPLSVVFSPPHADMAVDTDLDSQFDYLYVYVNLQVYLEDTYRVIAVLCDSDGVDDISERSFVGWLDAGAQQLLFEFDGWLINEYGEVTSFLVELRLETYIGHIWLDADEHMTAVYDYADFGGLPAQFSSPYGDHSVDLDEDGLLEYLEVSATVLAFDAPDNYVAVAILEDTYGDEVDITKNETEFATGSIELVFRFDAWRISQWGENPVAVYFELYNSMSDLIDGAYYALGGSYDRTDFDPEAPLLESGWAYDSPSIDGTMSPGEWLGAGSVSYLDAEEMNLIGGTVIALNNATHLFLCVDVVGDATETVTDSSSVAFDTYNDGLSTDLHEDIFGVMADLNDETWLAHMIYEGTWWHQVLPFDDSFAAAIGFGTSSESSVPHRIYEYSVPLETLEAGPGDVLGFSSGSWFLPGVHDADEISYSYWPVLFRGTFSLDLYGNLSLSLEQPSTTCAMDGYEGSSGWFNSDVEVTLTASTGTGGIDSTWYRVDGSSWAEYDSPFTVSGDGIHEVEYYSTDIWGKEEPVRLMVVKIDSVAPTTSVSVVGVPGLEGWLITTPVTVEVDAVDETSGVDRTLYWLDGGDWKEVSDGDVTVSADGAHVFEFMSIDVAGNQELLNSTEFKLDMTPPMTSYTVEGHTVTLSSVDLTSGLADTRYRIDEGEWQTYTDPFEVGGKGTHTVEFFSGDVAGNYEPVLSIQVEGATSFFAATELWIVLLIIGLMAAIAVPAIFGMRRRAREADAKAVIKDSVTAVAQLQDDNRQPFFPETDRAPLPEDTPKEPPESPEGEPGKDK